MHFATAHSQDLVCDAGLLRDGHAAAVARLEAARARQLERLQAALGDAGAPRAEAAPRAQPFEDSGLHNHAQQQQQQQQVEPQQQQQPDDQDVGDGARVSRTGREGEERSHTHESASPYISALDAGDSQHSSSRPSESLRFSRASNDAAHAAHLRRLAAADSGYSALRASSGGSAPAAPRAVREHAQQFAAAHTRDERDNAPHHHQRARDALDHTAPQQPQDEDSAASSAAASSPPRDAPTEGNVAKERGSGGGGRDALREELASVRAMIEGLHALRRAVERDGAPPPVQPLPVCTSGLQ
jgi:hypothetical protein